MFRNQIKLRTETCRFILFKPSTSSMVSSWTSLSGKIHLILSKFHMRKNVNRSITLISIMLDHKARVKYAGIIRSIANRLEYYDYILD